jgi:hypothetical protein
MMRIVRWAMSAVVSLAGRTRCQGDKFPSITLCASDTLGKGILSWRAQQQEFQSERAAPFQHRPMIGNH